MVGAKPVQHIALIVQTTLQFVCNVKMAILLLMMNVLNV